MVIQTNKSSERDLTEREQLELNLRERIKELNCHTRMNSISQQLDIRFEEKFQKIANLLPPSWLYPEIACARITFKGKEYKTENWKDTRWKQSSDIKVGGQKVGVVELCYLEEKPILFEGPFMKEERALIDVVAGQLANIVRREELDKKLSGASVYTRSLIEASLDPLVTIGPDGKITDVNESTIKVTGVTREKLIGTKFSDYFTEPMEAETGYKKVLQEGEVRNYPLSIKNQQTGKIIDVSYNASVYKDAKGNIIGIFASARDVTKTVLEGAEELLVEWGYALNELAFASRGGYNTFKEIEKAAATNWLKRVAGELPKTETAYQAAVQFRDLADQRKVIAKQNFQLEEKGGMVQGIFLSKDCPYRKCCMERKKIGKQFVCFRAAPFIKAIKLMAEKEYKSEVLYEQTEPGRSCLVRGLPTEMTFTVGLSYKVSRSTVKIHELDCQKIGIGIIDQVMVQPTRKEITGKRLVALSYSQTKYPPGMILMNVADAKSLGLLESDTIIIRKAKEEEVVELVKPESYEAEAGKYGGEYTVPGLEVQKGQGPSAQKGEPSLLVPEAAAKKPAETQKPSPEKKAPPPVKEKEEIGEEESEAEDVEEKAEEETDTKETPVEKEKPEESPVKKKRPVEGAVPEGEEEPEEDTSDEESVEEEREQKKKKKKNSLQKEPKIDKTQAMKNFEDQIDTLRRS